MLERRPRRAEVVLLTHEFAIGLPPVLRDGYCHFLCAADLRLLDLDQDLTKSLRGIKRQNQRLFTRLCGNPATCPGPRWPSNAQSIGWCGSSELTSIIATAAISFSAAPRPDMV